MKRIAGFPARLLALVSLFVVLLSLPHPGLGQEPTPEPTEPVVESLPETVALPDTAPEETPQSEPTPVLPEAPVEPAPFPTVALPDVQVTGEATALLPPAPEATNAPTLVPVISATAPATPLPPEPPLVLVASESFDAADAGAWRLGEGWSPRATETGGELAFTGTIGAAQWLQPERADVALEARFSTRGTAQLLVRQSGAGSYVASRTDDGRVELARGSVVLGVGVAPVTPGAEWATLRLSALGGMLRVSVDGQEVIALADAAPLPAGAVSVAAILPASAPDEPAPELRVDDVRLAVPASDAEPTAAPTVPPAPPVHSLASGSFATAQDEALEFSFAVSDDSGGVTVATSAALSGSAVALSVIAPAEITPPFVTLVGVRYTPLPGFAGADSFTLEIADNQGQVVTVPVVVEVIAALAAPEPTVDVTVEVTVEATDAVPVEATPELTAAPALDPPLGVLFSSTFDDADLADWIVGPEWTLTEPDASGNRALASLANDSSFTSVADTLLDVAVEASMAFPAGEAWLAVRQSAAGSYAVAVDAAGNVTLLRAGHPLSSGATPPNASGRITVRLSAIGGTLRVSVDGVDVLSLLDDAPLPPGAVAVGGAGATGGLTVDDITVLVPLDQLPEAPTEEPLAPEPPLDLLVEDDFDDATLTHWQVGSYWSAFPRGDGYALQVAGSAAPLALTIEPLGDGAAQVDAFVLAGAARLTLRGGEEGGYTAVLDAEGRLAVYRLDALLASAPVAPFDPLAWHALRLSVIGGVVRAGVDGVTLVTVEDPAPLPPGRLSIAGDFRASAFEDDEARRLLVDNVAVWTAAGGRAVEPVARAADPIALQREGVEYRDRWAVTLDSGADPEDVARSLGFDYVGPVGTLDDTYLFARAGSATAEGSLIAATLLGAADDVEWFNQQVGFPLQSRAASAPSAPVRGAAEAPVVQVPSPTPPPVETRAPDARSVILVDEPVKPDSAPTRAPNGIVDPGEPVPAVAPPGAPGWDSLAQSYATTLAGNVTVASAGLRAAGEGLLRLNTIPAGATVERAFLYWATIGYSSGFTSPTLNGTPVAGALIGGTGSTCWTDGVDESNFVYRADVTGLVMTNGVYAIGGLPADTETTRLWLSSGENDTQGASLVVIYRLHSAPRRTILIRDGAVSLRASGASYTDTFSGFAPNAPLTNATSILLVGDGQSTVEGPQYFNNRVMATNPFTARNGWLWDAVTTNVTGFAPRDPVSVRLRTYGTSGNDCLLWAANILSITTSTTMTEPLFGQQWHLLNSGQSGGVRGQDVNVLLAWNRGITGEGAVIAVVDDGIQADHPDVAPNYRPDSSTDFIDGDDDPTSDSASHGTAASGMAAARDDGTCGLGSAYRAGLSAIRLARAPEDDANTSAAETFDYQANHIYTNSWGPWDFGDSLGWSWSGSGYYPGWNNPLAIQALADGVANGRGGLGTIYVWAAGNGRQNYDNVNADHFANSRYAIAVGAVDNRGVYAPYSEQGAAMFVTAPSSKTGLGVTTTDLLGAAGYSGENCTNGFGGTSASAPLVAGVIALMLDANPNLGWRDVQHILALTAAKNDPANSDWRTNAGGYRINHNYGFGRVNAAAAVAVALNWENVPPEQSYSPGVRTLFRAIPDNHSGGVSDTVTLSVPDPNFVVEHVEVVFNAEHPYRGDLEIILRAPSGTTSTLMTRREHDDGDDFVDWRFMTIRNWGERAAGNWTLTVRDRKAGQVGTFQTWELIVYGYSRAAAPTLRPTPLAPASGAYTNDTTPALAWTAIANASGYHVQIDETSAFSSPAIDTTVPGAGYEVELPLPDGRFYWRVRARNGNRYGPWSSVRNVYVDTVPTSRPTLTYPARWSLVRSLRPGFRWTVPSGAYRYAIDIDNDADFSSPLASAANLTGTSYTVPFTLFPDFYYVRVRAMDRAGNVSAYSDAYWIGVEILSGPANRYTFTTTTTARPSFSWLVYPGAQGYQVVIATDPGMVNVIRTYARLATQRSLALPAADALPHGIYYWRVNIDLGLGFVATDTTRTFTVTPAAPRAPVLVSPSSGRWVYDGWVELDWNPVTYTYGTLRYEVQVDTNTAFAAPLSYAWSTTTTEDVTWRLPVGLYYWRVRAVNEWGRASSWSSARSFRVATS